MGYRTLAGCIHDLERHGQLVTIEQEIDPHLEAAAIQRRVYEAGGPALLFRRVKGTAFPMVGNLFGTLERTRFLFRDTLESVRRLVELKVDPAALLKHPWRYRGVPRDGLAPAAAAGRARADPGAHDDASTSCRSSSRWPIDGGPFVTLPQVYTEDPDRPGLAKSNLGMYRVQLAGNQYEPNREVGLHYQIHRGIGVHHAAAIRRGEPLRVNVFVGGPPALTVAAVMPLPEGLPELGFAGALGGRRRPRWSRPTGCCPCPPRPISSSPARSTRTRRKPEGPFGDHLGYYSLAHDFPVLRVERVYHRAGADLAVHLGRPAAAGRHLVRRADPRADRPAHPDRHPRRPRRPRRRRGRRPPAAPGDRQRALRALRRRRAGRRRSSPPPTPSSARGRCRWPSTS